MTDMKINFQCRCEAVFFRRSNPLAGPEIASSLENARSQHSGLSIFILRGELCS